MQKDTYKTPKKQRKPKKHSQNTVKAQPKITRKNYPIKNYDAELAASQ